MTLHTARSDTKIYLGAITLKGGDSWQQTNANSRACTDNKSSTRVWRLHRHKHWCLEINSKFLFHSDSLVQASSYIPCRSGQVTIKSSSALSLPPRSTPASSRGSCSRDNFLFLLEHHFWFGRNNSCLHCDSGHAIQRDRDTHTAW